MGDLANQKQSEAGICVFSQIRTETLTSMLFIVLLPNGLDNRQKSNFNYRYCIEDEQAVKCVMCQRLHCVR